MCQIQGLVRLSLGELFDVGERFVFLIDLQIQLCEDHVELWQDAFVDQLQPLLARARLDLRDEGLSVIALEARGDRRGAEKFMSEKEITFKNFYDEKGKIGRELFGVYAYLTSFIIDEKGFIQYRHIGFKPEMEQNLRAEIAGFLS